MTHYYVKSLIPLIRKNPSFLMFLLILIYKADQAKVFLYILALYSEDLGV